jgi:hypothetical protein
MTSVAKILPVIIKKDKHTIRYNLPNLKSFFIICTPYWIEPWINISKHIIPRRC